MEKTLAYLREILSNYTEHHSQGKHLYHKLVHGHFANEEGFVQSLDQAETDFLNEILPKEIHYAKEEKDQKRAHQLNEVYELLL